MIPIISPRVTTRPFANFAVYPFLMAMPDTTVPKAFSRKNPGMVTTLMINGPIRGINAISAPNPVKSWVKTPNKRVTKTTIFLSAWLTADHVVLDCNHHFGGTSKALQQEKNRLP